MMMKADNKTARLAGLFFLLMVIFGLFSEIFSAKNYLSQTTLLRRPVTYYQMSFCIGQELPVISSCPCAIYLPRWSYTSCLPR